MVKRITILLMLLSVLPAECNEENRRNARTPDLIADPLEESISEILGNSVHFFYKIPNNHRSES